MKEDWTTFVIIRVLMVRSWWIADAVVEIDLMVSGICDSDPPFFFFFQPWRAGEAGWRWDCQAVQGQRPAHEASVHRICLVTGLPLGTLVLLPHDPRSDGVWQPSLPSPASDGLLVGDVVSSTPIQDILGHSYYIHWGTDYTNGFVSVNFFSSIFFFDTILG